MINNDLERLRTKNLELDSNNRLLAQKLKDKNKEIQKLKQKIKDLEKVSSNENQITIFELEE